MKARDCKQCVFSFSWLHLSLICTAIINHLQMTNTDLLQFSNKENVLSLKRILFTLLPLTWYQRAGSCRSCESQSSRQADLFVTICEAFDSSLFAFYGCDAWFGGSLPGQSWLKARPLGCSVRLQLLSATQAQTNTLCFINLFHPHYPSAFPY